MLHFKDSGSKFSRNVVHYWQMYFGRGNDTLMKVGAVLNGWGVEYRGDGWVVWQQGECLLYSCKWDMKRD